MLEFVVRGLQAAGRRMRIQTVPADGPYEARSHWSVIGINNRSLFKSGGNFVAQTLHFALSLSLYHTHTHIQRVYVFRMVLPVGDSLRAGRSGYQIFCIRPDRPWGPHSFLYDGYRVYIAGVKWPGHGFGHPPPPNAEVKDRVELYLYSCPEPLWPVLWRNVPLYLSWLSQKKNSDNFAVQIQRFGLWIGDLSVYCAVRTEGFEWKIIFSFFRCRYITCLFLSLNQLLISLAQSVNFPTYIRGVLFQRMLEHNCFKILLLSFPQFPGEIPELCLMLCDGWFLLPQAFQFSQIVTIRPPIV